MLRKIKNKATRLFLRRKFRNRFKLKRTSTGILPRLSVFRSNNHVYAQIIDDSKNITVVASSTMDKTIMDGLNNGCNKLAAEKVGKDIALKAVKAGVINVVFDRGAYLYHGRIKALADSARENGLKF
jgi:large subunit ribosomal protein L18